MDPEIGRTAVGMGGVMFVVLPLLFVGIIALGIYFAVKAFKEAKRRKAAIASVVAHYGLGYLPEDRERTRYFTSTPFGIGDNRRARDVVWGEFDGRAFETFAYSYETETTDSDGNTTTTTHRFQVTWVPLPARLPTLRLTADNKLKRLGKKLGARDLDTESHEFNQRWKVWYQDERVAHAMLTPRMIERFLAPDTAGRGYVFEGNTLFTYKQGVSDLTDIREVVSRLHDTVDLVPKFLFEDPVPGSSTASV